MRLSRFRSRLSSLAFLALGHSPSLVITSMNKNLFRLVHNPARSMLMAVAETVSTASKAGASRMRAGSVARHIARLTLRPMAFAALVALAALGTTPAHAQVAAAGNLPPSVIQTANGLQQVDINTPSAAGVSQNTYSQFDVPQAGVILNNASTMTQTQQAGMINGNPHLAPGQSARIILNQVDSNAPSQLRGHLEVAGNRAEVIVANGAGIVVDGGGFINTTRGILTTGTPIFDANGGIQGFDVTRGGIAIQGAGLNAANVDQVDLLARAVQANAVIYGKTLNVITGANRIDHDTLGTTVTTGDGSAPAVSVDVSALGGMYANRITLVGTENGVGVTNGGTIAAQLGDLTLTSAGHLVQTGKLNASGDIAIDAQGIANSGTVYAQRDAFIRANDTLANSGTLAAQRHLASTAADMDSTGTLGAGIHRDGSVDTSGNLTVTTSGRLRASGLSTSGGNVRLEGSTLDLADGKTSSQGDLTLLATRGDMDLSRASTSAQRRLVANAKGTLINDHGALAGRREVTLDAARLSNVDGKVSSQAALVARIAEGLTNRRGIFVSDGAIDIRSGSVANHHGQLQSGGSLSLTTTSLDNTAGRIVALGTDAMTVVASETLTNAEGGAIGGNGAVMIRGGHIENLGVFSSQSDLDIAARSLDNSEGTLRASNLTSVRVTGELTNRGGSIAAGKSVTLDAETLANSDGAVQAEQLSLRVADLVNRGGTITQTGAGPMSLLISGEFDNSSGGTLQTNSTNLALSPVRINNNGGTITHAGNGTLTLDANSGDGEILNVGGTVRSNGIAIIRADHLDNSAGSISSKGGLSATLQGALINAGGKLLTNGDITLASQTLTNADGIVNGGAKSTVRVDALTNRGGTIVSPDLDVTSRTTLDNDHGTLKANQLSLKATDLLNRSGTITHYGATAMRIDVDGLLDNSAGGVLQSNGSDLTLTPSSLNNNGGKILSAGTGKLTIAPGGGTGTLTNVGGEIVSGGQLSLLAAHLDNTQGALSSRGDFQANILSNLINSHGLIRSLGSISLGTDGDLLNVRGRIQSGTESGNDTLSVRATTIDNTDGLVGNLGNGDTAMLSTGRTVNRGGVITGNGRVAVTAAAIDNIDGAQLSGMSVSVNADTLDNTGGSIGNIAGSPGDIALATTGVLTNAGGEIGATRDLSVSAASLAGGGGYRATQDVAINVSGDFTLQPTFQFAAGRNLSITLPGTFTNGSAFSAIRHLTVTAGDITNYGSITVGGTLATHSRTLRNVGSLVGGDVSLTATSQLSNIGATALIGATNADGTLELLAPFIDNVDDTTGTDSQATTAIYGLGRVVIAGLKDASGRYVNASRIQNHSALIQSGADMALHADQVTNTRRAMQTSGFSSSVDPELIARLGISLSGRTGKVNTKNPNAIGGVYIEQPHGGEWNSDYMFTSYWGVATANTVTSISPQAQIMSGANLNASAVGLFQNYWSAVSATGDIAMPSTLDQNSWRDQAAPAVTVRYSGHYHYNNYDNSKHDWQLPFGDATFTTQRPGGYSQVAPADVRTYALPAYESSFVANGTLSGSGVSVENTAGSAGTPSLGLLPGQNATEVNVGAFGGNASGANTGVTSFQHDGILIDPVIANAVALDVIANLTIPQGGLFRPTTAPGARYVIESNPAFTNAKTFISSDYYLKQIGVDPQTVIKRLGDGMYEQQLVRNQITALTGRAVLGPFGDTESMFEVMMTSGAALAKSLNLPLGMSLSAEQVAALTSDVIVMQTQVVDGQAVLVPVVYLAQTGRQTMNGPLIAARDVDLKNTQQFTNSGTLSAERTLTVDGKSIDNAFGALQSGGVMTLSTVGDVDLSSATVNAGSLALKAGGDLKLNTTVNRVDQVSDTGATRTSTTLGPAATLNVTGDAVIATGGNFEQNAGTLNVGGNLGMAVSGNWELSTVQTGEQKVVSRANGVSDTNINAATGSAVTVGGVSNIGVGGNLSATGADINLKGGGAIAARGDVTLQAAVTTSTVRSSSADSDYSESSYRSDDAVMGTTVHAGDSLTIASGNDINLLGSGITLERGTAMLAAARDVVVGEVTETHEYHGRHEGSRSGFVSSKRTSSTMDSKTVQANGSMISADAVAIVAGNDLSVRGSTIVGGKGVALQAGRDLTIQSTESQSESHSSYEEKRSGFGMSGGVGVSYGSSQQRDRMNESSVTQTKSLVGALDGNVSMIAGNELLIRGSDIVATGDVTGIGQSVTIESSVNRQHQDETHEMKRSGFTLAIKSPVIDAVQNVANQTRAAVDNGGDARVSALRGYAAGSGAYGAYGEGKAALDALKKGKVPEGKVELSWGSSSSKSTSSMDMTQNDASNIRAGGTVALIATGDAASGKGNVNITGSNVDARDVLLQATNQVNLRNSTDTESMRSDNQSKNAGFGVSYGTSGFGISASVSKGNGDANTDSAFQNNTHISASNTAVIVSGGDTNIVGAVVDAKTVIARVGGDLNVASVQDTTEGSAHQQSMGGGVNLSMGGASGSASYARGNASGNYAGVIEQSGLQAGDGGFDIAVAGNTDLKGAYIASTADASKNRLTTGTLTFSDVENHSDYSANSFGFGGGFTVGNGGANERTTGKTSGKNKGGISPMLPQMESGSERATTRTGVSEGTIVITDAANQTQDLANLNRDTADLNGTVTRTPDLQNLLSDQSRLMQAATAAGEAVARDIGTYADKKAEAAEKLAEKTNDPALKAQYLEEAKQWSEGGDYRATMHAAGGALVAGLGGGNALGGALGAGLTSKLGPVLNGVSDDIRKKRPTGNADMDEALGQIVATGLGTAVGAMAGGSSGAFTGFNTDRFNRQLGDPDRTLAEHIANRSNGKYSKEQVEDQLRLMGIEYSDGSFVPPGVVEELNGRTPSDTGARWIDTRMENAQGNPLIVQSMPKVDRELQAYIMSTYESATPGQVPLTFTYVPTPVETDARETVANLAGGVSTAASRFGAITTASASIPSPYSPGLATASFIATVTAVAADAVVQLAKPNVGQYWTSGGSALIVDQLSTKYPMISPAINETANIFNSSDYSKLLQNKFNSFFNGISEINNQEGNKK
ncbi:hemagglutinin repeat-containing protein [Pandoraea anapnoica]|nr:hemagglutinin repeat-containing protein [Pandoraea anapnoica]